MKRLLIALRVLSGAVKDAFSVIKTGMPVARIVTIDLDTFATLMNDVIGQLHPWHKSLEELSPEEKMTLANAYELIKNDLEAQSPEGSTATYLVLFEKCLEGQTFEESGLLRAKQCYEELCFGDVVINVPYYQRSLARH